jgi:zinc-ribbon family
MIFFGSKATTIGQLDINDTKCQYCENTSTQQLIIFGKYFHIYWIPFFPTGKEVIAECTHCKRTIDKAQFSSQLMEKYQANKSLVKRPFWHWTGLGIVGSLVLLLTIIDLATVPDPRSELLKADVEKMSANPSDSISMALKSLFNSFANEEVKPEEFEYLTKIKDDKVLILAKIPSLKNVQKEGRKQVIDMIELVANADTITKNLKKYIGVHGKYNMMMVKTPTSFESSNIAFEDPLFEFYGPATVKKQ